MMKKTWLRFVAITLTVALAGTMYPPLQSTAKGSNDLLPDYAVLEELERINEENKEQETAVPQYNENEYIVVKDKGVSSRDFIEKITQAAPKVKFHKKSLRDEVYTKVRQYKNKLNHMKKINQKKDKPNKASVTLRPSGAADKAAETPPSVPTASQGMQNDNEEPQDSEEEGESDSTPDVTSAGTPSPFITSTPVQEAATILSTTSIPSDDISSDSKEIFLIEAQNNDIEAIKKVDGVLAVEKNIRVTAFSTDFMPWGIKTVGTSYAHTKNISGKGVKVAVIDSGILEHPDLKVTGGYNFINGSENYTDTQGHGTFVAGIINAQLDGMGIAGIAPSADLYALKVVDDGLTGSLSDVIEAIYWAIENEMDIINMSFGLETSSLALKSAVKDADTAGVMMVASSGNGTADITYPAKYDEVIAVGAIDNAYKVTDFSAKGEKLDFVAPGAEIYSTDNENAYATRSGTSYSAAHVTGIAASILSVDKNKSSLFVKTLMKEAARNLGKKEDYGYGMPDLKQALTIYDEFEANFAHDKLNKNWEKPAFSYNKIKAEDDKVKLFDEGIWFEEARTVKSSPVPLPNNLKASTYTLSKNGAKQIKVHFKSINTESGYDFVSTNAGGKWSGNLTDITSSPTSVNSINVLVDTDGSVQSQGFEIDKIYYEPNDIPTSPFMVTAQADPDKKDGSGESLVKLQWRASYDSDKIVKYEIYQVDSGRQLKATYTGFDQNAASLTYSLAQSYNSGYHQFVIVAYDKYGNKSSDSKVTYYNRFDPVVEKIVVQQPMATGTPKVIAKYDNGTYATSAPNVAINSNCEISISFYDAEAAFVRVDAENVYRNWIGQGLTTTRTVKVPYMFRKKGSNKVKLELINQKGKQVSKTLDINVTDTSAAPAVPGISYNGNEKYFFGQDGVNPATGNFSLSDTDIEFTYPGMGQSITRTYNSRKTDSGGFGRGWSMSLEGKVTSLSSTQYRVNYGDGSEEVFTQNGSKYTSALSHNVLEVGAVTIGGISTQYRVTQPSGFVYGYNTSGYLVILKEKYGDVYKITLTSNKPTQFTGPSGRYIDIVYNIDGLIESITDDTARYSKYCYNNKKQLVTRVSGSARSTYYSYDGNGFLNKIQRQLETWNPSDMITLKGEDIAYDSSYKVSSYKKDNDQYSYYQYNYGSVANYTRVYRYAQLNYGETTTLLEQYFQYNSGLYLTKSTNEGGEITYYDVNAYGETTKVTDRLGNVSSTEYDANGNMLKSVSPNGYTKYYKYNSSNDVICESDTNLAAANANTLYHNTTWSIYDAKGRIKKSVSNKEDCIEYNNSNTNSAYLDGFFITTYKYQDEVTNSLPGVYGNMVIETELRCKDGDTTKTKTEYIVETGDKKCTIVTTSPSGEVSKSVINSQGREIETYAEDGSVEEYYMDNDGFNQRTIEFGKVSNNIKYQVVGVTREVIDLAGNTKQEVTDDEYNANYDGLNFGTSKHVYVKNIGKDWEGTRYKTSYSASMEVNEEIDPYGGKAVVYNNQEGNELKSVSEASVESSTKYDKLGRILETWEKTSAYNKKLTSAAYSKIPKGDIYSKNEISAPNLEKTDEITYDDNGAVASTAVMVADFDGKAIRSITKDSSKTNEITNQYNIEGKLVSSVNVSLTGTKTQETKTTYMQYDERGRVKIAETPFEAVNGEEKMSRTETSYYDDDNVKEVKILDSAAGKKETFQSTYYEYDKEGRAILERVGSEGNYNYVQYVLNSEGKICIQITGLNAPAVIKTSITDADLTNPSFNPISSCKDTDYAISRNLFDSTTGQLRREIAEDGTITEYQTYDDFDQPTRIKDPNKNIIEITYDEQGRCVKKLSTAPSGKQTIETTDFQDIDGSANKVYKEITSVKEGTDAAIVTTKVFDDNIRLKEETTGNVKKEYAYDLEGKRTEFKASMNSQIKLNLKYNYDKFGLLQDVKNQNNAILESYTYFSDGRLQEKKNSILTTTYTYNLQGMITKLTAKKNSNQEIIYEEELNRNLNGQINKSVETVGKITKDYTYDRIGRLTDVTSNLGKTVSYTYDDYHNIANKRVKTSATQWKDLTYRYAKTKQMGYNITEYNNGPVSNNSGMDGFFYTTSADYAYDDNGNVKFDASTGMSYQYNPDNQLSCATSYGSPESHYYKYNSEGLMHSRKSILSAGSYYSESETVYTWDEDQIVFTATKGAIDKIYARGNGIIGTINESGAMTGYYVTNYHGDIVRELDSIGNVVKANSYDEFGYGNTTTGFGYAGEYYDNCSRTIYLRARSYNPLTGRFIEKDAYSGENENPTSRHLYTYCENDPINNVDPTGHWLLNAVFLAWSIVDCIREPSLTNFAFLAVDIVSLVDPSGSLSAAAKATKIGMKVTKTVSKIGKVIKETKIVTKAGKALAKVATKGKSFVAKGAKKIAAKVPNRMKKVFSGIGRKCNKRFSLTKKGKCFVAGTQVKTSEGNKAIEEVKEGDYVYAENPKTGEKGLKRVVQTFERESNELVHLKVNGEEITTTSEHPFYVPKKGWTDAIGLKAGDILVLVNGEMVTVEMVQHEIVESPVKVYNFEVEDFHTYYVSNSGVLVHNVCNPGNTKNYTRNSSRNEAFRKAKRDAGIPMSQQPKKVTRSIDKYSKKNVGRVYDFGGGKIISEHGAGHAKGNIGPHFNIKGSKTHHLFP